MLAARVRVFILFSGLMVAASVDAYAAKRGNRPSANSALSLQVALDRMRLSPGPIDGKIGANTRKALRAFQRARGLPETGRLDGAVRQELGKLDEPAIVDYQISEEDLAGPFIAQIPESLEEQAKLERLSYTSPEELLAEKFHMDVDLLKSLNPGTRLDKAGSTIKVASVDRGDAPTAARLEVNKAIGGVVAFDSDEKIVAFFPATIGSEETPSPSGKVEVTGIAKNPTYTYDPAKLNFKGVRATEKFEIKPGPNNPVGLMWIDLSEPGYGIHGSPEPVEISRQRSHGCVRLTNWDALDLAQMVREGVLVEFKEKSAAAAN